LDNRVRTKQDFVPLPFLFHRYILILTRIFTCVIIQNSNGALKVLKRGISIEQNEFLDSNKIKSADKGFKDTIR
jgi:hypothetical protein